MLKYLEEEGGRLIGVGERVRMYDNVRKEFGAEGVFEKVLADGFLRLRKDDGSSISYMAANSSMKFV